jgi:SMI1 / KNR4 family (SUKH-1)
MQIRDHNRWGPLSEETVRSFEARHDLALPSDYRAFLLANHGGVPEPNFYWVVPREWGSGICNVYGFGEHDYSLDECVGDRWVFGIPNELLPIGDDGCGNFLCIGVCGAGRGQMYYVDHEFGPEDPRKIKCIASSYSDFLMGLSDGPGY